MSDRRSSTGVREWRFGAGTAACAAILTAELVAVINRLGPPVQPALSVLFVLTVPGLVLFDLAMPARRSERALLAVGGSMAVHLIAVSVWLLPNPIWIGTVGAFVVWGLARFQRARWARRSRHGRSSNDAGNGPPT